jgi:hypothetical protein
MPIITINNVDINKRRCEISRMFFCLFVTYDEQPNRIQPIGLLIKSYLEHSDTNLKYHTVGTVPISDGYTEMYDGLHITSKLVFSCSYF